MTRIRKRNARDIRDIELLLALVGIWGIYIYEDKSILRPNGHIRICIQCL